MATMENKLRRKMFYTVTATVTTFVRADYSSQAEDILYEALLGNDPKNVLALAEVHMPVTSQRGVHSTIPVNEDIKPTWAQSDAYQRIITPPKQWEKTLHMKKEIIKNEEKETGLDVVAMQSATIRALTADRDKWKDMADCLADAIQDLHHMIPTLQKVTEEYLDLCDEFFGTDRG
jgi:ferric iron reductase protein FhuF